MIVEHGYRSEAEKQRFAGLDYGVICLRLPWQVQRYDSTQDDEVQDTSHVKHVTYCTNTPSSPVPGSDTRYRNNGRSRPQLPVLVLYRSFTEYRARIHTSNNFLVVDLESAIAPCVCESARRPGSFRWNLREGVARSVRQ